MINDDIWMIDDDHDDHEILRSVCTDLNVTNPILFFDEPKAFIKRLNTATEAPFLILCNTKLPGTSGFEMRELMLDEPEKKFHGVPFIFLSESASETDVARAFKLRCHGYFVKPPQYKEWKNTLSSIIEYWSRCKMPSKKEGFDEPLKH